MTEMLGVLAIIGVLSALFVWGYRSAINKSKANQAIYDAHLIASTIMSNHQFQTAENDDYLNFDECNKGLQSGYTFESIKETSEIFSVIANEVPKGVCEKITGMTGTDYFVAINNNTYFDINETNKCQEINKVNFYFDTTNAEKCGGRVCYGGRQCVENKCQCTERQTERNGVCECLSAYPNACEGDCYAGCPDDMNFNCKIKGCECKEKTHVIKNGACVCPTGKEEGADGKCHARSCTGGTAGNQDWTCYIDDQRCGYQCAENGLDCKRGICDKSQCPTSTTHSYLSSQNLFGCQNSAGLICTYNSSSSGIIFCYHPSYSPGSCCSGKLDGICTFGLCDPTECPTETTHFGKVATSFTYGQGYGCIRNDGTLQCTNANGIIVCADANGNI